MCTWTGLYFYTRRGRREDKSQTTHGVADFCEIFWYQYFGTSSTDIVYKMGDVVEIVGIKKKECMDLNDRIATVTFVNDDTDETLYTLKLVVATARYPGQHIKVRSKHMRSVS